MTLRPALPLLIGALAVSPAFATSEAGLRVDLPDDTFLVEATGETGVYSETFGVSMVSGTPAPSAGSTHLCQIGFQPARQNADFSQDEINAYLSEPEWVEMAQGTMSTIFNFEASERFEQDGLVGHEFIAVPQAETAQDVRVVLTTFETPAGRSSISCATDVETLDAALEIFRTIRRSIVPPA
jgi:hypothetical protein